MRKYFFGNSIYKKNVMIYNVQISEIRLLIVSLLSIYIFIFLLLKISDVCIYNIGILELIRKALPKLILSSYHLLDKMTRSYGRKIKVLVICLK